jgi:hypothetical protein
VLNCSTSFVFQHSPTVHPAVIAIMSGSQPFALHVFLVVRDGQRAHRPASEAGVAAMSEDKGGRQRNHLQQIRPPDEVRLVVCGGALNRSSLYCSRHL